MTVRVLVVLSLVAAAAAGFAADSPDRRSRYEPEMAIRDGGRSGACDAIQFDRDGNFLFTGGDDKVVTVWEHTNAGLTTAADKVRVLQWPAWREQRGGIKDLAVSPDGKRVLVGGYGLRVASVAILDRDPPAEGQPPRIELTWPKTRPGLDSFRTVQAVTFSSDGKRVAFGTEDGSVWLWEPKKRDKEDDAGRWYNTPLWVGRHPADFEKQPDGKMREVATHPSRRLFFRDEGRQLVSLSRKGEVTAFDVSNPATLPESPPEQYTPPKPLFTLGLGVFHAAFDADRDRLIVAVHRSPKVLIRPLDGKNPIELTLPKEHVGRTVAADPKTGAVAVAVGSVVPKKGDHQFHNDADDEVWVYRKPAAGGAPDEKVKLRGQGEALAFHPKLDRLAVGGGDASEVSLFDLSKPAKSLAAAHGVGRKPWEVALTANGQLVGVKTKRDAAADVPNRRGSGSWTGFNLQTLRPLQDVSQKWVTATDTADDWTVVPDKADRDVWYVSHKDGLKHKLSHDKVQHNKPTCYTFLPAAGGRPTRLLVGHYHGASLYLLPNTASEKPLPPSRVFYGHAGEVLSVAALDDAAGGWFVTGGADHTLAAFSLRAWDHHPTLGATFEPKPGGGVEVKAVAVGSPGWEAGLRVGETLELLCVGGYETGIEYDRRAVAKAAADRTAETYQPTTEFRPPHLSEKADPKKALESLVNPVPRRQLYLGVRSAKGEYRELNTAVTQRPLWKLFLGYDDRPDPKVNDWVIWMWKGSYFHTESVEGDRKVGWHVNGPTTADVPRFYAMKQFAETTDRDGNALPLLHRKGVIQKLLSTRDVKTALEDALGDDPQAPDVNFFKPDMSRYEPAAVDVAADANTATDRGVTVTVRVNPRGKNIDLLPERVELWVNDHRYKTWNLKPGEKFAAPADLPPDVLRTGENQLTALTFNAGRGRGEARHTVTFSTTKPRESDTLALGVGINDYQAHQVVAKRGGARDGETLQNLRWASGDATGVIDQLRTLAAGTSKSGELFDAVIDAKANRQGMLTKLDGLKAKVKSPDDVLVLFLAGHGVLTPTGGAAKPGGRGTAGGDGRFVFCCHDFDPKKVGETSVSSNELVDKLAAINCRKVLLFDVCHSGQAADANVLRRMLPPGQGPFIVAACDQGQLAYEDPKAGHGLFTAAVLDALGPGFGPADADGDRKLSGDELFASVSRKLPDLLERAGKNREEQTPTCFPRPAPNVWVARKPPAK